jgi:hypothetical protein
MTKGENNYFKRKVTQMEAVLNLCVNKETMHENNVKGT